MGTGQVADPRRSYAIAYAALVGRASREGNSRALQELNEVGAPPYKDGKGFAVQRKWSNRFEGAGVFLASTLGFALTAPRYSLGDIDDWLEGQIVSAERGRFHHTDEFSQDLPEFTACLSQGFRHD